MPQVINATRAFPQYIWLHQEGAADLVHGLNPHNQFLDRVIQVNAMRNNLRSHNTDLGWSATLEVMLLASCDAFVGKFTSSLFRLSYELHAAECDCAAPYISLDDPWCYDWGEFVASKNASGGRRPC